MFWDQLGTWGGNIALYSDGTIVTYEQLERFCDKFSERLPEKKTLVLIETDNSLECIIALYGSLRKGHTVLLCERGNTLLKQNLCDRYNPELLYEQNGSTWTLVNSQLGDRPALHNDLALLITTSGSTGQPKCVRISRESIQANTHAISSYLQLTDSERGLLLLPIFYCYGLSVLNTHLSRGASIHLKGPSVEHYNFVQYLKEHAVTSFSGVPYTYELLERTGFRQERLPDLRYMAQAGGKLRQALVEKFELWARGNGSKMYVMYGQAEAASRIAYMPPELLADNPDCIGHAIPGGQLSLLDADDHRIEESGVEGELVYTGPNVMMGYATTKDDLGKGRVVTELRTGDLGMRNEKDLYKITGRIKRICKIYGKRYNLDDIEQALRAFDCSAVCTSNDEVLFIGSEREQTAAHVAEVKTRFGISTAHIITHSYDRIPLLTSGKVDYQTITQDCTNRLSPQTTQDALPVQERLLLVFSRAFPDQPITERESFFALNGDSLSYVAISIDIEQVLGVLPDKWEKMTIRELSEHATKKQATSSQTLETGVALHALSILAIVLQHYDLSLGGGGVLLMLIAGRNFCRFHLNNFLAGSMQPAFLSITRNILLPYWAILIYYNITYDPQSVEPAIGLSKFLLIGNYYFQQDWLPFPTWFIEVLIQSLLFIALPLSIPTVRNWAAQHVRQYLLILCAAAIFYRIIDGVYLMELYPIKFADKRTAWELWVFVMGMVLYTLHTPREKTLATIALMVLTVFFWTDFWSRIIGLGVGGTLIIWKRHITVHRAIVPAIKILGSASLFIYMVHLIGMANYLKPYGHLVQAVAGVLQGILVWFLYKHSHRYIGVVTRGIRSMIEKINERSV